MGPTIFGLSLQFLFSTKQEKLLLSIQLLSSLFLSFLFLFYQTQCWRKFVYSFKDAKIGI
ncbi:transmembrane protein, putative [Medicago truncatula]|uniref:Transmembrane protein, putative n=1 Tax=Medicago truncatula TaxID=3880 RepID=G7K179_MEDTR|nr:transmembrane protein, putative [Medicago truncatula]